MKYIVMFSVVLSLLITLVALAQEPSSSDRTLDREVEWVGEITALEALMRRDPTVIEDETFTLEERLALHFMSPAQADAMARGARPETIRLSNGQTLKEFLNLGPLRNQTIQSGRSFLCLEVTGASTTQRALVRQNRCSTARHRLWSLVNLGGAFALANLNSGMCLDVRGASHANRANVQQFPCHFRNNQQWFFSLNRPTEVVARHSGKCLDVRSGSTAPGALVQQFQCHGGSNQSWIFSPVP